MPQRGLITAIEPLTVAGRGRLRTTAHVPSVEPFRKQNIANVQHDFGRFEIALLSYVVDVRKVDVSAS